MPRQRPSTTSGSVQSAPYGKACVHCFKAKCRCIVRPDGRSCERCYRLQKACEPSDSARNRAKQKDNVSMEKATQLEEKLDRLMSMLRSVSDGSPANSVLNDALDQVSETRSSSGQRLQPPHDTPMSSTSASAETNWTDWGSTSSAFDKLPMETLETSFNIFRQHFLPFCPFIYFSPDTTARDLQQSKPFLLRCIAAVTTWRMQDRITQEKTIIHILAQEAVVNSTSSLDLLLGILTFVNWSSNHLTSRVVVLSRLSMIALSIVYDMRLNAALPCDQQAIATYSAEGALSCDVEDESFQDQALEQQRAVLGCFLVTSFVSIYFSKIDPMRWTPQMDGYLSALQGRKECSSDEFLAHQVRLQLIVHRAILAREQSLMSQSGAVPPSSVPSLPMFVMNAFQTQLQDLKAVAPLHIEPQDFLTAYAHYIELSLSEMAYCASSFTPTTTSKTGQTTTSGMSDIERVQCYWRSVHAMRNMCDALLRLPVDDFAGMSFIAWTQLSRGTVTLVQLSVLNMPTWDCQAVQATVNAVAIIDRLSGKLKGAMSMLHDTEQSGDDIFTHIMNLMDGLRVPIAHKLAAATTVTHPIWRMESDTAPLADAWEDLIFEGALPGL